MGHQEQVFSLFTTATERLDRLMKRGEMKGERRRIQPEILAGPDRRKVTAEIVGGDNVTVKMEDEVVALFALLYICVQEPRVKIDASSLAVPEALGTLCASF